MQMTILITGSSKREIKQKEKLDIFELQVGGNGILLALSNSFVNKLHLDCKYYWSPWQQCIF